MTIHYFTEMMAELGFHTADCIAVGRQKDWPCSIEFEKDAGNNRFVLRVAAGEKLRPVVKSLKGERIPHLRWLCEAGEGGETLVCVLTPPSDFYAKGNIHGALNAAVTALEGAQHTPPVQCPLCGSTGCDAFAYVEEATRPVHSGCLTTRLNLPEADVKTPLKIRGSYVTGILGALLGAAVGALPNWAQALSSGTISAILYAFIPFVSALLYRLFRGKARQLASGVIVLLSSLGVAFLLELVWFWLLATTQAGYNKSITATTAQYFAGHTIGLTLREMFYCLLFLLLGFLVAAVLLRRYAASGTTGGRLIRGAAFVRKTAFTQWEGKLGPLLNAGEEAPEEDEALAPATLKEDTKSATATEVSP